MPKRRKRYVKVLNGTPQWEAWLSHYESRPECRPYLGRVKKAGLIEVPSQWPPGHENGKKRRDAA